MATQPDLKSAIIGECESAMFRKQQVTFVQSPLVLAQSSNLLLPSQLGSRIDWRWTGSVGRRGWKSPDQSADGFPTTNWWEL